MPSSYAYRFAPGPGPFKANSVPGGGNPELRGSAVFHECPEAGSSAALPERASTGPDTDTLGQVLEAIIKDLEQD